MFGGAAGAEGEAWLRRSAVFDVTAAVPCQAVLVWKLILSVGCHSLLQESEDRLSMGFLHVILI